MDLNGFHIVRRIEENTKKLSDKVVFRYRQEGQWVDITWRQLNQRIWQVSRSLLQSGVNQGQMVGIFSKNAPEWMIIDLGCSFIKACAVPIYATNSEDQLKHIVNHSELKILFVGDKQQYQKACNIKNSCPSLQTIVSIFDNFEMEENGYSKKMSSFLEMGKEKDWDREIRNRIEDCKLDDLYTVIYTSGTTGDPKGVMIDYQNIAYQFVNHDIRLKIEEGKDSLSILPLSHVYERIWNLYLLHKGGVINFLDDIANVPQALKEIKPHYMCVVPRLLEKIYAKIYGKVIQSNIAKRLFFSFSTRSGKQMFKKLQKGEKASWFLKKCYGIADEKVFKMLRENLGGNLEMVSVGGASLDPSIGRFFRIIGVPIYLGYGMTETSATVTVWEDIPTNFKSVGTPVPHVDVKIGEDNEILVKGGSVTKGYYKSPQENQKNFTPDGYLKTGDAGGFDKFGNLVILDRIKELMKTSNGKYIAPQQIEGKIGKDSFIEQIAIIADAKNYVSALIVPNFEALSQYAKEINLKYKNATDLIKNSKIVDMIEKRIHYIQRELPSYEQIKKFTLLPNPFSIDKDELTPTLKLKRKNIYKKYQKIIDSMYNSSSQSKEEREKEEEKAKADNQ